MQSRGKSSPDILSMENGFDSAFFESSPLPIYMFDLETLRFLRVNQAAVRRYGYSTEEFLGMKASEIRPPEEIARFKEAAATLADPFFQPMGEWCHKLKSGEIIDVEVSSSAVSYMGRRAGFSIIHDVTERKRAEAALRQSEAKYRELIESMPVGYYRSTSDGRFKEANPAFCRMLGYGKEELLAMDISATLYFAPSEREGETKYAAFSPVTEVYRLKSKDGSEVWLEDYARYIRDENGRINYHEGICQDITARKYAQDVLQFSASRLKAVIENSSDPILFLDQDWRLIECLNTPAYERITGYSVAERLGKTGFDMFHPDDLPVFRNRFPSADKPLTVVRAEYRIKRKDGSWRWVEGAARNMLRDPSIKAMVISVRDIEERKAAESMLLESEERYRLLVDNSPDATVVINDGRFVYVNPATVELLRAGSMEQLVGRPISDFIHPDSRGAVVSHIGEMIETRRALPLQETKIVGLDGSIIQAEVQSAPVMYLGKTSIQSVIRDVTGRRQVEEQLHLQSVALNTAANGIVITDVKGDIVWVNPAFESLTGYSLAESVGKNLRDLIKSGKQDREFYRVLWNTILAGKVWQGEIVNKRKDGTLYTEDMAIAPVRGDHGAITHFVAVKQDVTDRKSLQEQLLQSQKLESIGQLAGGVAHDYNNILGVVIGYAQLLKAKHRGDYEIRQPADAILTAATRGADLTRQLLAFARKEMISPKVLNINSSIEAVEKILRRVIGENINLVFDPGQKVWNIAIDPSQLDQLLVNLAANSRDAIKGVGSIWIATANVSVDKDYLRSHAGLNVGDFVKLSFSDTGMGMDEETLSRIFEPFFTTKEKGQGTGLGLSTVYGIVKQNGGSVYVTSKPGQGTTFEIYLPRYCGEAEEIEEQAVETPARGSETILVVEDQAEMLELTKVSLENYGYRVMTALGPGEALLLCEAYSGTIHLLLTDVIMPVMSGRDLSEKVRSLRSDIRILFMSGYTANELDPEGVLDKGVEFIQKPFTPAGLAGKIREVLRG